MPSGFPKISPQLRTLKQYKQINNGKFPCSYRKQISRYLHLKLHSTDILNSSLLASALKKFNLIPCCLQYAIILALFQFVHNIIYLHSCLSQSSSLLNDLVLFVEQRSKTLTFYSWVFYDQGMFWRFDDKNNFTKD